jgi:nickel transport system substrate-binding protein
MLKKMFVAALSLGLLLMAVIGCSKDGETGSAGTGEGISKVKEITLSESWAFDSGFSPLTLEAGNYGIMYFASNFYETLVCYDNEKIVPGLAESWEVSDDGLVYTFYLRRNVKFTDGAPFNAEAVKKNLEFIPANLGVFNGFYGVVTTLFDEIKAIEPYIVEVRLTQPYYGALNDFAMRLPLAMVSPNAYNEDGSISDVLKTATCGTGPYMYQGETDGTEFTFVKNPDYWGAEPDVDRFHVKVISDNDTRQLALRNGEVDILIGTRQISLDGFNEMSKSGFGALISGTMNRTQYFALNVQNTPFNDVAVRQAANYAINKAIICQSVLSGIAEEAGTLFPPGTMYCNQNLVPYEHDQARAIKLLEDAGWFDTNGDGVLDKDGIQLKGDLLYATDQIMMEDIALIVQDQLKKIGMDITLVGMEVAACYAAQANGEYDMAHTFTYGGVWDPHTTIANAKPIGDSRGSMGVLNRAFTLIENSGALIAELNTSADADRIQEIYDYLMTQAHEQALFMPLYYPKETVVYNASVIQDYTFTGTYNSLGYMDIPSIKLK